jgi:molybdate transport system regulatory protein
MRKKTSLGFRMRIRVYTDGRMLGPGKMELLQFINATGSLSEAAKQMGMSYMRAWTLVREMNRDPRRPFIEMTRGGLAGGNATVTDFGQKVLSLYQRMEAAAAKAANPYGAKLMKLLQ